MEEEKQHSCRNDERTISDIEKYGLSVILIEATDYLPSFAYSIGLWEKYSHPEIIYRQPLLDRNADFKFREVENLGVFTTRQ